MLPSVIAKISPRRRLACVLTTVGALALIGTASAAGAAPKCQLATLNGTYAFSYVGSVISETGSPLPFSRAGFLTFDGNGSGVGVMTLTGFFNGVNYLVQSASVSLTYVVNSDCTGSLLLSTSVAAFDFHVYVSPSGDEFSLIDVDTGFIGASTATRVSK